MKMLLSCLPAAAYAVIFTLVPGLASAGTPDPIGDRDFPPVQTEWVMLGRDLFYDPLLSGNQNIACATCHHPKMGTADALSLGLGQGGIGLGRDRAANADAPPRERVPRNAPALWNVGAVEYSSLFHDGRVARDPAASQGIAMPEGFDLPYPVRSVLGAQSIMPIMSPVEMAGEPGDNPIADLVNLGHIQGPDGAWAQIAGRVNAIPAYRARFEALTGQPARITDIGQAIADFMAFEFRATDSPFDRWLAGDPDALDAAQQRGAALFYGEAGCASCHSGPLLTDHGFHAIGIPQIGPGKHPEGYPAYADTGRAAVTKKAEDEYCFRTPSLRMVTETAPYGHSGAYQTLEAVVRHHLSPAESLISYHREQAVLTPVRIEGDWRALEDQAEITRIAKAIELQPVDLGDQAVDDIVAFLHALTDEAAATGRLGVPASVPSGLPVDR